LNYVAQHENYNAKQALHTPILRLYSQLPTDTVNLSAFSSSQGPMISTETAFPSIPSRVGYGADRGCHSNHKQEQINDLTPGVQLWLVICQHYRHPVNDV
jgi:hypothetical protein